MFIMDTRPDEIAVLQERAKFSLFLQERETEKERERERGREGEILQVPRQKCVMNF